MSALTTLVVATVLVGGSTDPMRTTSWFSADLFHLSRTLPAVDALVDTPVHPGVQLGYHRRLLGQHDLGLGVVGHGGFVSFDELFWSLSAGVGIEGSYRTRWGLHAALGMSVDYARVFTGDNNFVLDDGEYVQETDPGRGYLRLGLVDLTLGYAPAPLRRWGVVPALRLAWLFETPLFASDGANPWSYTELGLSVLWMWEGGP